jgi:hypothetical protein
MAKKYSLDANQPVGAQDLDKNIIVEETFPSQKRVVPRDRLNYLTMLKEDLVEAKKHQEKFTVRVEALQAEIVKVKDELKEIKKELKLDLVVED